MFDLYELQHQVRDELYRWIDESYRNLPKKSDGSIDPFARGLEDNDIDVLRHAYVSAVYTMEYSESLAEILGRIKEIFSFNSSNTHLNSENMDLWNNAVGRKYGKLAKNRRELFELLIKALKNGELIIDLHDKREYKGKKYLTEVPESFVIVIKETATGENLTFFDLFKRRILSKSEFISSIKLGLYPNYIIKKINGEETPVSKKDKNQFNNLG